MHKLFFIVALFLAVPAQAKCLFIGDSIALGAGREFNARYKMHCDVRAKIGAGSREIGRRFKPKGNYDFVVVSMGSNNPNDPRLKSDVAAMTNRINAKRVVWLVPYNSRAAAAVKANAAGYFINLRKFKSRDGVHPNYAPLAKNIRILTDE